MALDGKGVEQSHTGEQGVVSGREDTGHDDGVDDTSGGFGTGHLKDDGERRGLGFL